jgi:hypothetical protein
MTSRSIRVVALVVLLQLVTHISGANSQSGNPLFEVSRDPKLISVRVRLALPSLQRALQLITNPDAADSMAQAVQSTMDGYSYLRAAQESGQMLLGLTKYPDPLLALHKDKIWQVRLHLLKCLELRGHLLEHRSESISVCTEHLDAAVNKLEILLMTLP